MMPKDRIGQEVRSGDTVVHAGMGSELMIEKVHRVTEKGVYFKRKTKIKRFNANDVLKMNPQMHESFIQFTLET